MKSLKTKILGGISLIVLAVLIMGIYGVIGISNYNKEVKQMIEEEYALLKEAEKMKHNVTFRVVTARGYVLYGDPKLAQQFMDMTEEAVETQERLIEEFGKDPEYAEIVKEVDEKTKRWRILITDQVVPTLDRPENGDLSQYSHTFKRPSFEETINIMEEFCTIYAIEAIEAWQTIFDIQDKKIMELEKELLNGAQMLQFVFILISIISITVAITIGSLISRSIVKPIKLVVERLTRIAKNDLKGEDITINSKDELGTLSEATNEVTNNLRNMATRLSNTEKNLNETSNLLTSNNDNLIVRTNEVVELIEGVTKGSNAQSQSAEETSSAMQNVTDEIQTIAQTTNVVAQKSNEVNTDATNGNKTIKKTIEQMNTISKSFNNTSEVIDALGVRSNQISQIVEAINNIADQTNLLALNAAIEAARAGEHGKGFAVVADEVRKLAEQSKNSSEEIAGLISQIQEDTGLAIKTNEKSKADVETGLEIVNEAGEAFERISEAIRTISSQIQEVSASSEEISASSEEVSASIVELSRIAKENAESCESTTKSSEKQLESIEQVAETVEKLNRMSEELKEIMDKFEL